MGKLQIIVDGQMGSCGKGHVAAQLAAPDRNPRGISAVRVAGANAGHSAVDSDGRKWPLRQIPVAAVVNPHAALYIAAGSEVDPRVLLKEIHELEEAGHHIRERLLIDAMATIIEPRHLRTEAAVALTERIGSTAKGIGAARSERIMRVARVVRDTDLSDLCAIGDVATQLREDLAHGATAQIEGTQGWALGLHHPFYPQVTSSDCRAIDFAAMAGISPWDASVTDTDIWVVYRPHPIRVAGNSGPLAGETTWEALGLPEERTTVTKLVRRVGTWDGVLARQALLANGGPSESVHVALTMADQLSSAVEGVTEAGKLLNDEAVTDFIFQAETDLDCKIELVGTSDRTVVWL